MTKQHDSVAIVHKKKLLNVLRLCYDITSFIEILGQCESSCRFFYYNKKIDAIYINQNISHHFFMTFFYLPSKMQILC